MTVRLRTLALSLAAGASALCGASQAWAWGATGHRLIGRAAILGLPADLPAFLRTPLAVDQVGELAREPDRSKGSGQPHDADRDPGHFVDIDDSGHIFDADGPRVEALPANHAAYDVALGAAHIEPLRAGYLPYEIEDGYQQLVRDFSYWRIEEVMAKRAKTAKLRKYFADDLKLRQQLTIRDLGVWAHYVGDASQPMHASIHYNGWGDYPNPHAYTQDHVHGPFEGAFVHDNVTEAAVRRAMPDVAGCGPTIQACTSSYLLKTQSTVEPFYRLWGQGAFQPGRAEGRAFATERVAAGAIMLRDLVVQAWNASHDAVIGRGPEALTARDVEHGKDAPFELLYGDD